MSNYTQPQFHLYRNKPTDELEKLLISDSATVIYKSLVVLESRKIVSEETFDLLKEISENGKTFKNRKMACILLQRFFSNRSREIRPAESKLASLSNLSVRISFNRSGNHLCDNKTFNLIPL